MPRFGPVAMDDAHEREQSVQMITHALVEKFDGGAAAVARNQLVHAAGETRDIWQAVVQRLGG